MRTTAHDLHFDLGHQLVLAKAGKADVVQGRFIAYVAGKIIYLMNSQVRYHNAKARPGGQPVAFFEPPAAARLRAVAARKTLTSARTSVTPKKRK